MPLMIENPLRILALAPPSVSEIPLLQSSETFEISTRYYDASIPIWRDNIPGCDAELATWREAWSKDEAAEVVQAIGAWMICFSQPSQRDELSRMRTTLRTIHTIIEQHNTATYSAVEAQLIVLVVRSSTVPALEISDEEWEDLCQEEGGWEYINASIEESAKAMREASAESNNFGEKVGLARLREALEANEWESGASGRAFGDEDPEIPTNLEDFETEDLELDSVGLRKGLLHTTTADRDPNKEDPKDEDVQALESMMMKMQAIRDAGADMPAGERKKLAAKTVNEVMRTL